MALIFQRIALVGATGPTGRALASELVVGKCAVRVVARRADVLKAQFPASQFEKQSGDAMEFALAAALRGCDLVIDCIGLPGERMADHPATARNIARFVKESGARSMQVSSYWSFMPIKELPVSERHPRQGGPPWARFRREAEDILRDAGGSIVHLPDFFGPHVHMSTLQLGIIDPINRKPMSWIGSADVKRDYIYVPDASRAGFWTRFRNSARRDSYEFLNREVRIRPAPPWLTRFLQVVPEYVKPISFDGAKLDRLLGRMARRPYEDALRATIASIQAAST
jgi:nucleoside-diphosphate-sugar epimerase